MYYYRRFVYTFTDNATSFNPCENEQVDSDLSKWLAVFCVAQALFGYVSCSLWTIGITYLDENCKKEDSALYLGKVNLFLSNIYFIQLNLGFILYFK